MGFNNRPIHPTKDTKIAEALDRGDIEVAKDLLFNNPCECPEGWSPADKEEESSKLHHHPSCPKARESDS